MRRGSRWRFCCSLFHGAAFLLLLGCTLPLKDSPYQRIVKPSLPYRLFHIRVVVRFWESSYDGTGVSSRTPTAAEVHRTVCQGLESTRFRCLPENSASKNTDFVVNLDYGIIRDPFIRDQVRLSQGGLRQGIFGDHDPSSEEALLFQWRLTVERPEGAPVFRSQSLRERFDFWEFEVKSLVRRYFSE